MQKGATQVYGIQEKRQGNKQNVKKEKFNKESTPAQAIQEIQKVYGGFKSETLRLTT